VAYRTRERDVNKEGVNMRLRILLERAAQFCRVISLLIFGFLVFPSLPAAAVTFTEFTVDNSFLYGITAGPDGNLWFIEYNGNKIGKVSGLDGGPYTTIRLMHEGSYAYHSTFHDAYDDAADGDTIQMKAVDISQTLSLTSSINVSLRGGYDSAFVLNQLMTTVTGGMMIAGNGSVTVERLIIK
jgi:hypothetical protein